ncbi:MAG: LamG-like jellyroll fold domain-containing protein, partial [Bacteroidota bacterium]
VSQLGAKTVELTLTTAGSTITIVPKNVLGTGNGYTLTINGIMATDGQMLGSIVRNFTTEGAFAPEGPVAYWNFENNANDVMGNFNPVAGGAINITYVDSYKAMAGKAASFNGSTSLIEIPNGQRLDSTDSFTLAFWVKADSTKRGQFVMGLAGWYGFQFEINHGGNGGLGECKMAAQYRYADNTSGSEDLWFNGSGSYNGNGGWQGWTFCKDLTGSGGVNSILADKWAFVTCVYDAATKLGTMYLNGEKMKAQDFNLWPAGDAKLGVTGLKYNGAVGNNTFVFGFIQDRVNPTIADDWAKYENPANNHFKGLLDDVRIYHRSLTLDEITMMYNSAKP